MTRELFVNGDVVCAKVGTGHQGGRCYWISLCANLHAGMRAQPHTHAQGQGMLVCVCACLLYTLSLPFPLALAFALGAGSLSVSVFLPICGSREGGFPLPLYYEHVACIIKRNGTCACKMWANTWHVLFTCVCVCVRVCGFAWCVVCVV